MKTVIRIALLVATFSMFVAAFGITGAAFADGLKTIYAKALDDHGCNSEEWHFVITQIESQELAPNSILVRWANGASATVPLWKFTGGVGHYVTTANLDSPVVKASAQIYEAWSGQFNLSHGPCEFPEPTPTPELPTVTSTKVPPTPTATNTPLPPTATRPPTATQTPTMVQPTPTTPPGLIPTETSTSTPTACICPTEVATATSAPACPCACDVDITVLAPTAIFGLPSCLPVASDVTSDPWLIAGTIIVVALTALFVGFVGARLRGTK